MEDRQFDIDFGNLLNIILKELNFLRMKLDSIKGPTKNDDANAT